MNKITKKILNEELPELRQLKIKLLETTLTELHGDVERDERTGDVADRIYALVEQAYYLDRLAHDVLHGEHAKALKTVDKLSDETLDQLLLAAPGIYMWLDPENDKQQNDISPSH